MNGLILWFVTFLGGLSFVYSIRPARDSQFTTRSDWETWIYPVTFAACVATIVVST